MDLLEREIHGYYVALFIIPIAIGFVILTAVVIVIEWVLHRSTGRPDLRSIAWEVQACVAGGAMLGGIMTLLGALPGWIVAQLIVGDANLHTLKVAALVSTLISISVSVILFLLQKGAFRKDGFILGDELSPADNRRFLIWRILGWLLGSFWPVIGVSFLLRHPYRF